MIKLENDRAGDVNDETSTVLISEERSGTKDTFTTQADMIAMENIKVDNHSDNEKFTSLVSTEQNRNKHFGTSATEIMVMENTETENGSNKGIKCTDPTNEKQTERKCIDHSSEDTTMKIMQETNDDENLDSKLIDSLRNDTWIKCEDTQAQSHKNDNRENDSKEEKQSCPKSDNALKVKENLDTKPPFSLTTVSNGALMSAISGAVQTQNNGKLKSFPLDGRWEMSWKSFPSNNTTFVVHEHNFNMFDCPCEIMLTGSRDNYQPVIQWPLVMSSDDNPIFQYSVIAIPPGKTCGVWPHSIVWTTTDQQYGEITWTRLNSDGSKPQKLNVEIKRKISLLYPLDGVWELSWKSFPAKSSTFVIDKHEFKMFDYPCKILMGDLEDNYCPRFQWPEAVTSSNDPVFQVSTVSIPLGTGATECPSSIVWTTTDQGYGEITWTKLDSKINQEQDRCMRKRNDRPCTELNPSAEKRRALEKFQMELTIPGKAWTFVESALALQNDYICAIAKDDIVYLTERLLKAQRDFQNRKVPCHVDIAYHHTRFENLDTIKTDGLLSRTEREQHKIYTNFNGSAYGDGIYCSKNPIKHAYSKYGDTTILLARMLGKESNERRPFRYHRNNANVDEKFKEDYNTLVVPTGEFCVLRSCNQCVPLFRFKQSLLLHGVPAETEDFLQNLANFQKKVQNLLDKIFNENKPTEVKTTWTSRNPIQPHSHRFHPPYPRPLNTLQPIPLSQPKETVSYVAPESLLDEKSVFSKPVLNMTLLASNCSICSQPLISGGKVIQITNCGHLFHSNCIETVLGLQQRRCCPACHKPLSSKQWSGAMPSGSMTISHDQSTCEGFEGSGSIVIDYEIPCGIQKQYHPNPGVQFGSFTMTAYLPDTQEGRKLLKRLKFAFSCGLTFRVAYSNTVICFISHKTNQRSSPLAFNGNPNSYPDPTFISNTNDELNRLRIPLAAGIPP